MLKNYFKTTLRALLKQKLFSVINVFGLAVGLVVTLLILLYLQAELSYDKSFARGEQIYRVLRKSAVNETGYLIAVTSGPYAAALKNDLPESIRDALRVLPNDGLVKYANQSFMEKKFFLADENFFKFFSFPLAQGDPATALANPNGVVITAAIARKYFGADEPMGKTFRVDDRYDFTVTGVLAEKPGRTHLDFDFVASLKNLEREAWINDWWNNNFLTYVLIDNPAEAQRLEARLPAFIDKYLGEDFKRNGQRIDLALQPLADIYFQKDIRYEFGVRHGDQQAVYIFGALALFILMIASINYMNLTTARAGRRAREIGVRKVLGALRVDLIRQFLIESFLLNIFALAVALLAVVELAPLFHQFIGRTEASGFSLPVNYWFATLAIFTVGALLAGLYPAFVLSGYQPVSVLKGVFKNQRNSQTLRKGLIVAQFAASVALIAGTMIVHRQVEFMRRQSLGANIDQTLVVEAAASLNDSLYQNAFQPFKNEALRLSGVKNLASSSSVMGKEIYWANSIHRIAEGAATITLYHLGVDYDFVPAYNLELKAGRNFSEDFATDNKAALLNELAAKQLGFESSASAINQKLRRGRDTLTVVGVVANFHQQGLQKAIDPTLILLRPNRRGYYSAKIQTADVQGTLAALQKVWDKHFPADPFNFFFLDELFDQQYRADMIFGKVFGAFAFLAVLIACFGLLGLSAYNVVQRTKEIGVRKVLGASVASIAGLLSKDFVKLVLAANLVAWPIAYFAMNRWLQDFAYRVNIAWWVFALAGGAALLIALLTVSLQAIRAALANPVEALRYE